MLQRFMNLHEEQDTEILSFCKTWGVIGFCEHLQPHSHNAGGCRLLMRDANTMIEPIDSWRQLSLRANGIWVIGRKIAEGRRVLSADWQRAAPHVLETAGGPGGKPRLELLGPKEALSELVSDWITIGQVRPGFAWDVGRGNWGLSMDAQAIPNLFGVLALRLMTAIAGAEDIAVCSVCKDWFIPNRRPTEGKDSCCFKNSCQTARWKLYKRKARGVG